MKFINKSKAFVNRLYNNQGGQLLISVFITALCFAVLYFTHEIYWYSPDDVEAKMLVSGCYSGTPTFSAPFLNAFLGYFFTFLYSITDVISWYTIFHIVLIFVTAASIFRLTFLIFNRKKISVLVPILLCVVLFFSIFAHSILYMVFTVNAVLIGCAAIALIFIADLNYDNRLRYVDYIFSGIFLILSFLLRYQCGLVIFCFWILTILYTIAKGKKDNAINFVKIIKLIVFSILVFFIAVLLYKASGNIRAKYESDYYLSFNSYRSKFLDYETVSWYSNKDFYEQMGWDEDFYFLAKNSWFFMDERLNLDSLKEINSLTAEGNYGLTLKEKIYSIYDITVTNTIGLSLTLLIIVLFITILFMFGLSRERKKHLLKLLFAVCACGGATIMILYLAFKGRFLLHVYKTVAFPLITILLTIFYNMINKKSADSTKSTKCITKSVAIIASIIIIVSTGISLYSSYTSSEVVYENWSRSMEELEDFAAENPDKIFVHNNFVNLKAFSSYKSADQAASNIVRWGTCIDYSVEYYVFWNSHGYEEFYSKNFFDDNVYLAISPYAFSTNMDIEGYFNTKFGPTEFVEVYRSENLVIYDIDKT